MSSGTRTATRTRSFIAERLEVPLNRLTEIALENARRASPDASLVSSSERFVNGVRVAYLQINGRRRNTVHVLRLHYAAARAASRSSPTPRNLFDEYKPDLEEFLRGSSSSERFRGVALLGRVVSGCRAPRPRARS